MRIVTGFLVACGVFAAGYGGAAVVEGNHYDRQVQIIEQRYDTMCPQEDSCDYHNHKWQPVEH